MPREFTIPVAGTIANASGDYDLLEVAAASGKLLELLNFEIGQTTELGDAADEQVSISIVRGNTTSGSGGSAGTAVPKEAGSTIASTAFEILNSTPASAGTAAECWSGSGKILLPGPLFTPLPQGAGWFVGGSALLCVRLNAAVADDVGFRGTATFLEYG